jgi:hypothetical protein
MHDQLIAQLKGLNSAEEAADWRIEFLLQKIVSFLSMPSRSS